MLDEILIAGELQETSKKSVLRVCHAQVLYFLAWRLFRFVETIKTAESMCGLFSVEKSEIFSQSGCASFLEIPRDSIVRNMEPKR